MADDGVGAGQPRAVNISHSQLLERAAGDGGGSGGSGGEGGGASSVSAAAAAAELLDARRKFSSSLESNVLDYLHYSPQALEDCVRTLHTLFSNIVAQPHEPKFRRIKAVNKAYLRHVASVAHAEGLMLQAGWRSKVVDMEKSWVWEHSTDGHEFRVLQAATEVLGKALNTLHLKAEHKRKEDAERKSKHAEERERIRLALEDDRRQRLMQQELTAAHGPVAASSLPSAAGAGRGGGPGDGGGLAPPPEGEDEDE